MLSRISSFGINSINKSKINKNIILFSNNKIINNNKNQFIQLLNNSNNNVFNINNNNKYYSTSSNNNNSNETKREQPPTKSFMNFLNSPFTKTYSKDKGTLSLSNMFLLVFGLSCIYLSLPTLIMYYLDKDKPANDANLFTIMNYFNLYPPYRIFDKEGYIKRIVDSFKNGESTKEGRRILEMMIVYPSLDDVNYLEKYGFYDAVYDRILSKKTKPTKDDPDSYLVNLMMFSGKIIPIEVLKKIKLDTSLSNEDQDKLKDLMYFFSKVRHVFDITKSDILVSTLIAAPVAAFFTFRFRIPMVYGFNAMKRSTLVTAALISAPALNQAFQKFSINKSEGIGGHVVKTRVATMAYGSLLVYLSTLPFITVLSPIAITLLIKKTFSLFWLALEYQKDIKLLHQENQMFNNQKADK